MEQENELAAKNEETEIPETRSVQEMHPPSNPYEEKLKELNKTGSNDKNSMIGQIEEAEKSGEKSFEDMQPVTADNEFDGNTEEDSDESVKAPQKKKIKQGVLHYSEEEEDDDDSDNKSKITKRKRKSEVGTTIVKPKKQKSLNKLMLVLSVGLQQEPLIGYRTKTKLFLMMKG